MNPLRVFFPWAFRSPKPQEVWCSKPEGPLQRYTAVWVDYIKDGWVVYYYIFDPTATKPRLMNGERQMEMNLFKSIYTIRVPSLEYPPPTLR